MPSTHNSSALSTPAKGGPIELEQLDSADPPLGVHRLPGDGHVQLHRPGTRRWCVAAAVRHLFDSATARVAPVHRSVVVDGAVCHEVAQREEGVKKSDASQGQSASKLISERIA